MLRVTSHHRILLAVEPVDFRVGIDRLKAVCNQHLHCDPYSGIVFAFTNRARTSVKLLVYDPNGFWLCQKRFSQGKLAWWPKDNTNTVVLRASELLVLFALATLSKYQLAQVGQFNFLLKQCFRQPNSKMDAGNRELLDA